MFRKFVLPRIVHIHRLHQRFWALMLCLCILAPLCIAPSAMAGDGDEQIDSAAGLSNTYLLRVDTGIASGENVLYLAVRYRDENNVTRTELIFPHSGSLTDSFRTAAAISTPEDRLSSVEKSAHYTVPDWSERDGLEAKSHDEYLFKTYYDLRELVSIDVYQRYVNGTSSNGWSCSGMELFRVNHLYGLEMSGYYSSNYYIDFDGEALWSYAGESSMEFTIGRSDEVYHIGTEKGASEYVLTNTRGSYYSTHDDLEYLFEIDIADVYEYGSEKFATPYIDEMPPLSVISILEFLDLRLTYLDKTGSQQTVDLPVISSAVAWGIQHEYLDKKMVLTGFAQEGDRIVFSGKLPGFVSLKKCTLIYHTEAGEEAGVIRLKDQEFWWNGTTYTEPETEFPSLQDDPIRVTGIKIYRFNGAEEMKAAVTDAGCGSDMHYKVDANPIYFFCSEDERGATVSTSINGSDFKLNAYGENNKKTEPTPLLGHRYIAEITVDDMEAASTVDDITVVFDYKSSDNGATKYSKPISLRDAVTEFYGYWPGLNGEYAYNYAVTAGNTFAFYVDIEDVAEFTGVRFSMDNSSSDDFQFKCITIYKPEWVGPRTVVWAGHHSNGNDTDRVFSRDFDREWPMRQYGNAEEEKPGEPPIYINGESSDADEKHIDFDPTSGGGGGGGGGGGSGGGGGNNTPNWNELKYSMSFKEAKMDFGFTKSRCTYDVKVKVAGNNDPDAVDDSGSSNLFYFQLIFASGTSSYVLANQQLSADGFRAGQTETFKIMTNQDYGDLTAIRILPDDMNETNKSDIFDKLNIERIEVTKESSGRSSYTWVADNVGWIEIDFRDSGEQNTTNGQEGRTASQISRDILITEQGYSTNIMFVISNGYYDCDPKHPEKGAYEQMQGSVTATIDYYDSHQKLQHENVDIISAMYSYDGKKPVYSDSNYFSGSGDGKEINCALSNPELMLRGGTDDRFFVTLHDVSELKSIEIHPRGTVSTYWKICNISAWLVDSEGSLRLNQAGEYQRHSADEMQLIDNVTEQNIKLNITSDGAEQPKTFNFTGSKITIENEGDNWETHIERNPTGDNDSVNIYVHLFDDGNLPKFDQFDLNATMTYKDSIHSNPLDLKIRPLSESSKDKLFYAEGIRTPALIRVDRLAISMNSINNYDVMVDYALIQHVRSGVIVESYFVDYGKKSLQFLTQSEKPSLLDASSLAEKQVVTLFFGDGTLERDLTPEKVDVAVALRYKSENDISNKDYTSPYHFLTDAQADDGSIVFKKVANGLIATVTFNEPFVKEITGVTLATQGGVTASVDGVIVEHYQGAVPTEQKLLKWYDFASYETLSRVPRTITPTDTNVMPVEIEIVTGESREDIDTGTDGPISMTINYMSEVGSISKQRIIDDINDYLVSGSFAAGDTAKLNFLLKDVSSIRSITLEPYSKDVNTTEVWVLDTLKVRMNRESVISSVERKPNATIVEGAGKSINLSDIVLTTTTAFYNSKVEQQNTINGEPNGTTSALIYSGDSVKVKVSLQGSLEDYGYLVSAELVDGDATTTVGFYEQTGNTIVFTPPANATGAPILYRLIFSSEESPETKAVVEVKVDSEPVVIDTNTTENGNTKNGSTENGNTENGGTENGNTENGSTENGNTENGNTENGGTENGNTESGTTDNGNTGTGNADNGNTGTGTTDNGNTTDSSEPAA